MDDQKPDCEQHVLREQHVLKEEEKLGCAPTERAPIDFALILGAGWTGRQIAGQMIAHGMRVRLVDQSDRALEASRAWIEAQLGPFFDQGYWPQCDWRDASERLELVREDPEESHLLPGIVLECIPEQVALKRRVLKRYAEKYGEQTIIASNSSYFVPSTFSKHLRFPERYAHFHFHVPIWIATLVDVATAPETSQDTVDRLIALADRIGQTPLVQRVENTGYVFNWMLKSLLQSALQLVNKGVSNPEDIDTAWRKATGMPVGPIGSMDQIGLDIIFQTMSHARFVEGDDVWAPLLAILQPLVDQGKLGVKTGSGFFVYGDPAHWQANASPGVGEKKASEKTKNNF